MYLFFFFFKQKTAYEMRISDWSSDVCSSDLGKKRRIPLDTVPHYFPAVISPETWADAQALLTAKGAPRGRQAVAPLSNILRSDEHTSELQSLMSTSYTVSRLKTKNIHKPPT